MLVAMALLSAMDAMAKTLTLAGVTVLQILALRSLIIVPLLLAGFSFTGKTDQLRPLNVGAHLARGMIGFMAPLCFFLGIKHIPLTDAVVVFFSSIFFVTLLSIFFLGEKVGPHRWASVIAGFIGVLIIVGPKGGGSVVGYILVLAGSGAYSILFVSGRHLSATESVPSLVMSFNVCVGVMSLIFLPWFWNELSSALALQISFLAMLALGGHYLITVAFSRSEASILAPFEYTCVIWALVFDLLLWQIYPTLSTIVGALIIISSGLYIAHRERIQEAG